MTRLRPIAVFVIVLCCGVVGPVQAQSARGVVANGSISAAVEHDRTEVAVSGSLGYRFNEVFGLGVELSWIPERPFDLGPRPTLPGVIFEDADGDALIYTTNVRLEIPTTTRRLLPFVVGGGGVASTKQSLTVRVDPRLAIPVPLLPPNLTLPTFPSRSFSSSSTDLVLTLGGGLSLLVTDHLSFDVDLRHVHIRSNNGRNIGRFGAGASYRF